MDHPFLNPSRKICTFFTKIIFFSCPSFFLPVPAKTNTVFGRSYDPFFLLLCPIIYPNRARLPSIPVISRAGGHFTNTFFIRTIKIPRFCLGIIPDFVRFLLIGHCFFIKTQYSHRDTIFAFFAGGYSRYGINRTPP